jgi:hypothetical protein
MTTTDSRDAPFELVYFLFAIFFPRKNYRSDNPFFEGECFALHKPWTKSLQRVSSQALALTPPALLAVCPPHQLPQRFERCAQLGY